MWSSRPFAIGAHSISDRARDRIRKTLEETFASRLEIKTLDVQVLPSVHVSGTGLVLRQKNDGTGNTKPLILVDQFAADTSILELLHLPPRFSTFVSSDCG